MDVSSIIANKKVIHMRRNSDGEFEFDTSGKFKDDKTEINDDVLLEDFEYQKALDDILKQENVDNTTKFH